MESRKFIRTRNNNNTNSTNIMTNINKLTALLATAIIGLALGGCSDSTPSAPKDTIKEIRELLEQGPAKAAAEWGVKPFVKLDSLKTESVPLGQGQFKINLEITWKTEEALYAPDEIAMAQLPSVPNSITLLKQVNKSGEKIVVYGSIRAELLTKNHWKLDGRSLEIENAAQGKIGTPIGAFAHNGYVTGTPEADKAIEAQKQLAAELQAKARREAEERRIRAEKEAEERRIVAEREAQERAARAEQERKIREARAEQERMANAIREAQEQRVQIEKEIQDTKDNQERQVKALKAQQEQYVQLNKATLEIPPAAKAARESLRKQMSPAQIEPLEKSWQATEEQNKKQVQVNIEAYEKQTQAKIDQLDKETQPKLEQLQTQLQAAKEQEEKLRQEAEALRGQQGPG